MIELLLEVLEYCKEFEIFFNVICFTVTLILGNYLCFKDDPDYFDFVEAPGNFLVFLITLFASLLVSLAWFIIVLMIFVLMVSIPLFYFVKYSCIYISKRF